MNPQPIIELDNVTKTYQTGVFEVEVLHGISLSIMPGEYVAIMGASGSGKSTLMNIIGCLDRPTRGRYKVDGRDVQDLDADRRALLRRDMFGFIFQQYNLLASSTALENVEVPAIYAGLNLHQRTLRARELLIQLGLGDRLDHRPNQLSGGQQQRVSVARALMNGGPVILADEPTGALDSASGREVMELLGELNALGHTVILITHDANVAGQAGRVVTLADGLVVSDTGTKERLSVSSLAAVEHPETSPPLGSGDMFEAMKLALRSLKANLFRTALTLLGIVIGVGSVVAMLAVGDGAKQDVINRIQAMGTNLLLVRPGAPNIRHSSSGSIATLTPEDAEEIAKLPNVRASVPEISSAVTIRYGNADYRTNAMATSQDYPIARDWNVGSGVFFGPEEVKSYVPVVVLGQTVAKNLFPGGEDPVGRYVLLDSIPFQAIGVMAAKGATPFGSDMDDVAFVPLSTGSLRLFGQRYLRNITVQVEDLEGIDDTQEQIRSLLLARHRTTDFQIRNTASILETASETQNTLTILLGSIAAISLLVGGIGVMNIMLVSVTERTREIGVRMATGARAANILLQFITEAVVVCAIGGLLGVAGGLGTAWLARSLGQPVVFSVMPVALAFGCAFATGVIFGFMPARKAARLDPVVALASE